MTSETTPTLTHIEPVLAVTNLEETIKYWHEVIGFPNKWTYGEPPNHGGVSWHSAALQFSLNPKLAEVSKGNCIWIRVKNLQKLYEFHLKQGVPIVEPLENKPWGLAGYIIEEINGYYIIFAAPITDREKSEEKFPPNIRIVERKPSVEEYQTLISSVGWKAQSDTNKVETILNAALYSVVAEDANTGTAIGCALLLGDNVTFYYVKDVMIHPDWQKKRIGTELMQTLTNWIEANAPSNALIGLFTGEGLEHFYKNFGFRQGFGMTMIKG